MTEPTNKTLVQQAANILQVGAAVSEVADKCNICTHPDMCENAGVCMGAVADAAETLAKILASPWG